MNERFPSTARIRKRSEFIRVFSEGKRVSSRELRLVVAPNGTPHSRLGLAVSRKVGNAVARNRLKRRLREIFRRSRAQVPGGMDFVVIAQPAAPKLSFDRLREGLIRLCADGARRFERPAGGAPPRGRQNAHRG